VRITYTHHVKQRMTQRWRGGSQWGNRMVFARAEEHFEQVRLIPASLEAFGLDAGPDGLFLFEQIEGNVPEDYQVRRAIVLA
jgi:hypothetical protein